MMRARDVQRRLETRLADAQQLIEIHTAFTGEARGRRYDVDALNRGAIILAVAAWESFVEDLALYNSRLVAVGLSSASKLPENVRNGFLAWLYGTADFSNPTPAARAAMWSITGSGWRKQYKKYAEERIDNLHNPSPNSVRKLFRTLVGVDDITESWGYRRWGAEIYRDKMDQLLLLRHRIAHGVIGDETVGKTKARDGVQLVSTLSARTSSGLKEYLKPYNLNRSRRRGR